MLLALAACGLADEARIRVEWGDSATETYIWTMTGTPGQFEVALSYDDCTCQIVEYGDYGDEIVKDTLYTGGSGCLLLADVDTLYWSDERFARSNACCFTPVNAVG